MFLSIKIALGLNNDAQHFLHILISFLFPKHLKKVSCWPAKEALGKSSAVAELLIATKLFPNFYKLLKHLF